MVVLLHQGGKHTGAAGGADPGGCAGDLTGSPLANIVGRLDDGVDLVISGHTHAAYVCRLPNRAGRPVPVASAAAHGRLLTAIELRIDPAQRCATLLSARNLPAPARDGDATIDAGRAKLVAGYGALVAPLAERTITTLAGPVHNQHDQWWAC